MRILFAMSLLKPFRQTRASLCLPRLTLLFAALCMLGCVLPAGAQVSLKTAPSANGSNVEARAMQLLQQMVTAYSHLSSLEQQTEFRSTLTPLTPPKTAPTDPPSPIGVTGQPPASPEDMQGKERKLDMKLHLAFQQPNRLMLETQDVDAAKNLVSSRWVSDGKMFWAYMPAKHWYTQEKAPGNIRGFARLENLNSGCLELLMLMGINPFVELKEGVDSIRCDGSETINGVPTEVVVILSTQPTERVELRLYIGKADLLLRRLMTERTPIQMDANAKAVKVGDALDELAGDAQPPQPVQPVQPGETILPDMPDPLNPAPATPVGPVKARLVYDNIINTDAHFSPQMFVFTPPPGASLYCPTGAPTPVDPHSRSLLNMIKKGKTHKVRAPREVNP